MKHLSKRGEIQDRFWSRVDKGSAPDSCWNWTGSVSSAGYGLISGKLNGQVIEGRTASLLAHRVSWIMANGPIPTGSGYHGAVVMHRCDNRRCVNPQHLVIGTQHQNLRDMGDKRRHKLPDNGGHKNPMAVLTAAQELEVANMRGSSRAIANKYGVSKSVVLRVRNQHLTQEQRDKIRAENYRNR